MSLNKASLVLCAGLAVSVFGSGAALALDRHVIIVNNTSFTINEFYASSVGQKSWQEDILGNDTLKPGGKVRINIDDGTGYCKYDLRAVFNDGTEAVKQHVNICEVGTFTFNE